MNLLPPLTLMRKRAASVAARARPRAAEQGSAIFVVVILLAIMSVIVAGNSIALRHLKKEIKRVEKKHHENLGLTNNVPKVRELVSTNFPSPPQKKAEVKPQP